MKYYFVVLLLLGFVLITCSESNDGFERMNFTLQIESTDIQIFVKYKNRDKKIVDQFYLTYEKDENQERKEKLAILKNGVIKDRFGKVILDLTEKKKDFFGFVITPSYPKSKRFSPGLNLDPYFGSADNVGDTQRIQWDEEKKTFEKHPSLVP